MNSTDSDQNRITDRAIALVVAITIHVAIVILMIYTYMRYPRPDMPVSEVMQQHPVTLADVEEIEYEFDPAVIDHIMAGEPTAPVSEEAYGGPQPDAVDAGEVNESGSPVSTPEPSPVQATEARREQAASDAISKRTGNAFGKPAKGDKTQRKDDSRSLSMTIADSPGARSDKEGRIVFRVNIDGNGRVVGEPQLMRAQCEGNAGTDDAIIERCRTIAGRQRFRVIAGSATQTGTITFTFTDHK